MHTESEQPATSMRNGCVRGQPAGRCSKRWICTKWKLLRIMPPWRHKLLLLSFFYAAAKFGITSDKGMVGPVFFFLMKLFIAFMHWLVSWRLFNARRMYSNDCMLSSICVLLLNATICNDIYSLFWRRRLQDIRLFKCMVCVFNHILATCCVLCERGAEYA